MSTVNPSLPELEDQRSELYAQLADTGDFRRGSVSENYRRCGKANCACAAADHPGHGPRLLWTRTPAGGKTTGRQLSAGEVDKVRRELAAYQDFARLSAAIVAVNEAICEARALSPPAEASGGRIDTPGGVSPEKRGSTRASPRRSRPR